MEVIDTSNISDELWEKYYDFEKAILAKNKPDRKIVESNVQEFKKSNLKRYKILEDLKYIEYLLIDVEEIVGRFDAGVDYGILAFGFVTTYGVLPEEIFRYIASGVYERMLHLNLNEAYYWSYEESFLQLMIKIGIEKTEEMMLSRLEKEKANINLFKTWIDDTESKYNYKTVLYKELPKELFEKYLEFVNPIFKDIDSLNPWSDKISFTISDNELIKWNAMDRINKRIKYYYVMYGDKEEIIAVSYVVINKNNSKIIMYNGGLTGVKKEYRGKGFGKYLKAKMFLKLVEDFPEFKFIHTDTMPWNKYMYKINEEFGFKPYKRGAKFKFTKGFLENYLNIK